MAEALAVVSAASSILHLIEIGSKVASRIKEYSDKTKDVPKALRHIAVQLPLMLEMCEDLRQDELKNGAQLSQTILDVIKGFHEQVIALDTMTKDLLPSTDDHSMRKNLGKAILSLKADKQLIEYQGNLESYKTALTLWLARKATLRTVLKKDSFNTFYHFPSSQISRFVAREKLLRTMEERFSTDSKDSRPKVVAILGMGGEGKTQLALEFCRQTANARRFEVFLWVDATSPATLLRSFETITEEITKGKRTFKNANSMAAFMNETLDEWKASWLMIFDNFDQPGTMKNIKDFFPRTPSGAILLTSRHADCMRVANHVVEMRGMEEEEAIELLFKSTMKEKTQQNLDDAKRIVHMLGCLPLAIDQASAYILSRNLPLGSFHDHYKKRKELILKHTSEFWEYKENISAFTTWEMDLEQIKVDGVDRESILHILTLFAFFNILKISEDLFRTYYDSSNSPPSWMETFAPDGEWDEFTYGDVIASSLKLSLLQKSRVESEEPLFSIHPLIRDWMQMRIEKEERRKYVKEAISVLVSYIQKHKADTLAPDKRREVLSHLDVSMEMDAQYLPKGHQLGYGSLEMAGRLFATYYDFSGRFKEAEELLKRMLDNELITRKQDLETDNQPTLEIIVKLSQVYFRQGRYEEAMQLAERCYQGYQTTSTSNSLEIADASMNFADCYYKLGKNEEAKNLYSSSLKAYEAHYHSGHEKILLAYESIAGVLRTQGEHAAAFELWHKALAGKETLLGKNHPSTLRTVVALANNYRAQCQYDRALPLLLRAVASSTASLGEDHPDTLNVFIHLGILYRNMGRAEKAEEMLNKVVEGGGKLLGGNHPDVLRAEFALGMLWLQRGKKGAEEKLSKAFEGRKRYLGLKNQATVRTVEMLAGCFWERGDYVEAEELCASAMDVSKPATQEKDEDKAGNKYRAAQQLFEKAVKRGEKNLGYNHPDTLDSLLMLANVYTEQGRLDEAEELFRRVLDAHIARLGRDDYETRAVKEALGLLRKKRGSAEFKIPISDLILDE